MSEIIIIQRANKNRLVLRERENREWRILCNEGLLKLQSLNAESKEYLQNLSVETSRKVAAR